MTSTARFLATQNLKAVREAKCSQEEMVSLINVETGKNYGRTFYGNIETGERPANADMALIIARILSTNVTELFTNNTPEEEQDNG